jgi:tetratricopeptide (TPR) repeat protein
MPRGFAAATVLVASALLGSPAGAEQGVLVVQVSDTQRRPVTGVRIATRGDGSIGAPTDAAGRTRIRLAAQTRPGAIVALTIVPAPRTRDFVFVSPWDNQVRVPPFENESQNFAALVVVERGERAALESGPGFAALVARVNLATSAREVVAAPARPADALNEVAALFGLTPAQVVAAIRASSTSDDPYERGMAALFEGELDEAGDRLTAALKIRETTSASGSRAPADAAFFLAQTLYREGNFTEAADAYRKALKYRPGDPTTTNNLGLTLMQAGDFRGAEAMLRLAINAIEAAAGPEDPEVVFAWNNLGALLVAKGEPVSALEAFQRGLAIRQKTLGPDDPRTANSMNNVASALLLRGDAAGAAPLLKTAAAVFARQPPPAAAARPAGAGSTRGAQGALVGSGVLGTPGIASVRLNEALLAGQQGRLDEARAIAGEVLRTQVQTFGRRSPETANAYLIMGQLELAAGNGEAAAAHYDQAVAVIRELLGAEHPSLAEALAGVGDAAVMLRDPARAKTAYDRAVAIRRRAFGDADPIAQTLSKKIGSLR